MTEPQHKRALIDTDLMQMLSNTSDVLSYSAFARAMNSAAEWLWGTPAEGYKRAMWRKLPGVTVFFLFIASVASWLLVPFLTLFPSVKVPWWIYLVNILLLLLSIPLIVSAPENSWVYRITQCIENTVTFNLPVFFTAMANVITLMLTIPALSIGTLPNGLIALVIAGPLIVTAIPNALTNRRSWMDMRRSPSTVVRRERRIKRLQVILFLLTLALCSILEKTHPNAIPSLWLISVISTTCSVIFTYLVNSRINLPKAAAATTNQLNTAIADYLAHLLPPPHTIDSKQLIKQALSFDLILGNDLLGRGDQRTPIASLRIRIALLAYADAIANSSRRPYTRPTAKSAENFADNPPVRNPLLRNRIRDIVDADKNLWARGNRKYRGLFFERQAQVINDIQAISRWEQIEHLIQFLTALERELNQCPRRRKQLRKAQR